MAPILVISAAELIAATNVGQFGRSARRNAVINTVSDLCGQQLLTLEEIRMGHEAQAEVLAWIEAKEPASTQWPDLFRL